MRNKQKHIDTIQQAQHRTRNQIAKEEMCKRCNHCDKISYRTANETDRQHGNRNTNRQLIHCNINSSNKSKAISSLIQNRLSGAADEDLRTLITAALNRTGNKSENQSSEKQTTSAER
ncbi:hypothetical protein QL285_022223 [Trifolium repens]|jgi:hypothetical protein|nr:hypothetical protein QL285_022223 [Trifolium repens]